MPSSEPFLSSSELEEVVLEDTWYFLFTVMGMLQLSRYLNKLKSTEHHFAPETADCLPVDAVGRLPLPDDAVKAADLLIGRNRVVFAREVVHAGCISVSGLQRDCRVLQAHCRALLSLTSWWR